MNFDLKSINSISVILRLVLAVICGGIIGLERGRAGRPAGFRTHILVCLGSALAIMTNQYILQEFQTSDPTRMAAQVISGIGFLGVGTIIVTGNNKVKGLTTAAGLWATACMGLAIGIGFYSAGLITCLLISFVTVILHPFDNYMLSRSKIIDVYIELSEGTTVSNIMDEFKTKGLNVEYIEVVKPQINKSGIAMIVAVKNKEKEMRLDTISRIARINGVEFAEDI
ncbi:MAG TPA: MgtC/SapB family protein [Clostridiales bacterium]|nr:MgtC/SapB family protein [Clostridiales bacterium]